MPKYVWLNIDTGKFSNAWDYEEMEGQTQELINFANVDIGNWKLIKFECLNDTNFEFNNLMKIN